MAFANPPATFPWKLKIFAAVVGPLYGIYQLTNRWHWRPPVELPLTWIDRAIPVVGWTVWPYLLLAGCIVLPLLVKDRAVFRRAMAGLACGYSVNLLVFAIWPTMLPRGDWQTGWHEAGFAWLHSVDSPANCFPSGHITAPFVAFHALATDRPRWRTWLWIVFVLLCPTILTTGQHYFVDLVGGLATGWFGVRLAALWLGTGTVAPDGKAAPSSPVFNGGVVNLIRFQRDPLRFFSAIVQEHGPVLKCRLAWLTLVLVADPAAARAVLKLPRHAANKRTRSAALIGLVSGRSLLTADGDSWFRLRRLVQPAFHHGQIAGYSERIERLGAAFIDGWKAAPNGRIEVASAMRRLTFRFICGALLGTEPGAELDTLERSINRLLADVWAEIRSPMGRGLQRKGRRRREFDEALAQVRGFIQERIAARRAGKEAGQGDLLAMLLSVRDADSGEGMSDTEIIDECVTLIIAGHDTTANALAWSLALLARNPAAAERLRAESASADGGRAHARAVFLETLRLYPPIWIIERNLDAAAALDGWRLESGSQVIISPWVLHRSPAHWDAPEEFQPERFLDPEAEHPAFLPFGDGPRTCIGKGLAMLEGIALLTLVGRAGTLSMEGELPEPDPALTLRPKGELWLTLS